MDVFLALLAVLAPLGLAWLLLGRGPHSRRGGRRDRRKRSDGL